MDMSDPGIRWFTATAGINMLVLAASCILVASNRTVGKKARTTFLASLVALAFITFSDWFLYANSGRIYNLQILHTWSTAITFAIAPAIPVAIAHTVFPKPHVRIAFAILALHAVLEFLTIFGGFIFWVDDADVYHRGPLYCIYVATYVMSAIYLAVESIRAGRTYQSTNLFSVLAILSLLALGVGIQVMDGSLRTTWPTVSIVVVLYFLFYTEMVLNTDALTKLLNRHSYDEFLNHPHLPCAVVMIDVNRFKQVNDTYGHAFGDECLATEAQLIRRAFGNIGLCYRTGGDEYTVMVTKRLDNVNEMCNELARLIEQEREKEPRLPTMSVGVGMTSEHGNDLQATLAAADQLMYENKRASRKD